MPRKGRLGHSSGRRVLCRAGGRVWSRPYTRDDLTSRCAYTARIRLHGLACTDVAPGAPASVPVRFLLRTFVLHGCADWKAGGQEAKPGRRCQSGKMEKNTELGRFA